MNDTYYFCCIMDTLNYNENNNTYIQNFLKAKKSYSKYITFELKLVKNDNEYIITDIIYQKNNLFQEISIEYTFFDIYDDTIHPNIVLGEKNKWSAFNQEYTSEYHSTLLIPYEEYEKHKLMNILTDNADNMCKLLDYLEDTYCIKLDEINNVINK